MHCTIVKWQKAVVTKRGDINANVRFIRMCNFKRKVVCVNDTFNTEQSPGLIFSPGALLQCYAECTSQNMGVPLYRMVNSQFTFVVAALYMQRWQRKKKKEERKKGDCYRDVQ